MEKPTSYCEAVSRMEKDNVHVIYHNTAYGFPIEDDNELFGRLILEINQAGLSWTTILIKQENFRNAYSSFNIEEIAAYTDVEKERLLNDAGIIRNRLKIGAAIHNAKVVIALKETHGTFKKWLDMHAHFNKQEWVKLFKKTFKFTGGEIVNEFLMSTGYLPGAHVESCEVFNKLNAFYKRNKTDTQNE
jgi:DNA-3-methyladenine glycosylase I